MIVTEGFCQKFNYNSQKKQNSEYNKELASALHGNDYRELGRILSKDPSLVDAASSVIETSKRLKIKTTVPLICDAVQRCLNQQCSLNVVEVILDHRPNLNCKYDGLPPFYMVLNYIACHKINDCKRAEELFFLFLNKSNIDIKERPADLPPPFSYLLTENFNFLNKHFNRDYISPEIIKAFVDKGASINTKDVNSNSILSFATITENQDLINYCIGNDAVLETTNKDGKDAFYYAVANKDYDAVKTILDKDYQLSESRLTAMKMQQIIAQAGSGIQELIFDKLKSKKKNLNDIKTLYSFFPNQRSRYLSDGFKRANLDLTGNQLSEFIDLFASIQLDEVGTNNLVALKKEYVSGFNTLSSFNAALKKYPIVPFNYSDKYYESESSYNALQIDLQNLKSTFPTNLAEQLSKEAAERQRKYITSDWKGNPILGKKVIDGYPDLYDKITDELYREIAGITIFSDDYSSTNTSQFMEDELNAINRHIQLCDDFLSNFPNSSYTSQIRDKRYALISRRDYVQRAYSDWRGRVTYARNKIKTLKAYVLSKGKTPNIEYNGEWEHHSSVGLLSAIFGGEDYNSIEFDLFIGDYHRIYNCVLYRGDDSHKYWARIAGKHSYEAYYNYDDGKTTDIGLAIREALWVYCYGKYESSSDNDVITAINYLENNKDGKWWRENF